MPNPAQGIGISINSATRLAAKRREVCCWISEKFVDCMKNAFTYRVEQTRHNELSESHVLMCSYCQHFTPPATSLPPNSVSTQMYWQQKPQCFPLLQQRNSQSPQRAAHLPYFLSLFTFICLSICLPACPTS